MPLMNQGLLQSLIILGLTEILCGFRSALEEITGKEIPESPRLESLEKLSGNNFALSDTDNNTSGPLNSGGIANLHLLRKLLAICQKKALEPSFLEVIGFWNPFGTITSLSDFYFRFRRFILLAESKK